MQIDARVTSKIAVGGVGHGLPGSPGGHFTRPDQASEFLRDLDVGQMRRMELVIVAEQSASTRTPRGV